MLKLTNFVNLFIISNRLCVAFAIEVPGIELLQKQ